MLASKILNQRVPGVEAEIIPSKSYELHHESDDPYLVSDDDRYTHNVVHTQFVPFSFNETYPILHIIKFVLILETRRLLHVNQDCSPIWSTRD